jgi:hypothetical protein
MEPRLRVDTGGVRAMAGSWQALAGDLGAGCAPGEAPGMSCQPSAAATSAGHADVRAGTAALAARLRAGAARVDQADTRYAANEAHSAAAASRIDG